MSTEPNNADSKLETKQRRAIGIGYAAENGVKTASMPHAEDGGKVHKYTSIQQDDHKPTKTTKTTTTTTMTDSVCRLDWHGRVKTDQQMSGGDYARAVA